MATMSKARAWQGPAILSYGFRPFFLSGGAYAALMIALWVPWYLGLIQIPTAWPPQAWHAHELLFGYVPAVVAGFLLTAVPNWTGRMPVVGVPLGLLFAAWLVGRIAVCLSLFMHPLAVALITLAFPVTLAGIIAREIIAGKSWRNLKVLGGVTGITLAQALFHFELWRTGQATYAPSLAIAAIIALIMIIGGRIVPSFTTNWIRHQNPGRLPVPFGLFDTVAMTLAILGLAGWVALPLLPRLSGAIAVLLLAAGLAQAARQARWAPDRTSAEPLVLVLHVAYAFVSLGFLAAAGAAWTGDWAWTSSAIHLWTVGAIGLMTLAVMTRATLGHTGRALTASASTVGIYAGVVLAAAAMGGSSPPDRRPGVGRSVRRLRRRVRADAVAHAQAGGAVAAL